MSERYENDVDEQRQNTRTLEHAYAELRSAEVRLLLICLLAISEGTQEQAQEMMHAARLESEKWKRRNEVQGGETDARCASLQRKITYLKMERVRYSCYRCRIA